MVAKIQKNWLRNLILFSGLLLLNVPAAFAQDFTQGYATNDNLLRGSVVSRNAEDPNIMDGATLDTLQDLFGVVVQSDETAISITSDTAGVFVASSGRFEVLVSNINGEVNEGDYITASGLKGFAMKADDRQELIVGQALQTFDTTDEQRILSTQSVTTEAGETFDVAIGRILVEVNVGKNPVRGTTAVPEWLQQFSIAIAGEVVSPIRIYSSLIVLLITFGLGGSVIYAGIRTSMVAIGRNPLSKRSVLKGFTRVAATAIVIFLTGFFAVYLMVRI